ncbi:MAG: hypothetical protein ACI8Q1_001706 [Parvicella sp.]|jgi:hypothetical protein
MIDNIRHTEHFYFLLAPLVLSVLIFVYIRIREVSKVSLVINGLFDARTFKRTLREENFNRNGFGVLSLMIGWMVISTCITYFICRFTPALNNGSSIYEIFAWISVGSFGYFWFKKIITFLLGKFTEFTAETKESFTLFKYTVISGGVILLPIMLFLNFRIDESTSTWSNVFNNGVMLIVLSTFVFVYILKIIQEIRQSSQIKISGYYLFLYFCTLEFLPLVVVSAVLMGKIG